MVMRACLLSCRGICTSQVSTPSSLCPKDHFRFPYISPLVMQSFVLTRGSIKIQISGEIGEVHKSCIHPCKGEEAMDQ